jgi:hypothetical protein
LVRGSALPGIVFGNGRSYGDVCLNPGGTLWGARAGQVHRLRCRGRRHRVRAGVLLKDIIDVVLPRGWFLPVVPGTQFVTVGGAIANDVHGKAHHVAGSFGRPDLVVRVGAHRWQVMTCSPTRIADWFEATVGGMGLTGVITRARLRLRAWRAAGSMRRRSRSIRWRSSFACRPRPRTNFEYTVSWIDCVSGGRGRGVFFQGKPLRRGASDVFGEPRADVSLDPAGLAGQRPVPARLQFHLYYARRSSSKGAASSTTCRSSFRSTTCSSGTACTVLAASSSTRAVVPPAVALDVTRAMLNEIAARPGWGRSSPC